MATAPTSYLESNFLSEISKCTNLNITTERKDGEIVHGIIFDLDPETREGPKWMNYILQKIKEMPSANEFIEEVTALPPSSGVKPNITYKVGLKARFTKKRRLPFKADEKRIFEFSPYLRRVQEERAVQDQKGVAKNPFGFVGYTMDIEKEMPPTSREHPSYWDLIRKEDELTTTGMLDKLYWELNRFARYSDYRDIDQNGLKSILEDVRKAYDVYDAEEKLRLVTQCLERVDSLLRNAGITSEMELDLVVNRLNRNYYVFDETCYKQSCNYVMWKLSEGMHGSALVDDIYEFLYFLDKYAREAKVQKYIPDPDNYPIYRIVALNEDQTHHNIDPGNQTSDNIDPANQTYDHIPPGNQTYTNIESENQSYNKLTPVTHSRSESQLAQNHSSGSSEPVPSQQHRTNSANKINSGRARQLKTTLSVPKTVKRSPRILAKQKTSPKTGSTSRPNNSSKTKSSVQKSQTKIPSKINSSVPKSQAKNLNKSKSSVLKGQAKIKAKRL